MLELIGVSLYALEGTGICLLLVSLSLLCLKIKSSRKNPEFLGVPGTLVHKNPDRQAEEGVVDQRESSLGHTSSGRELPAPPESCTSHEEEEKGNNKKQTSLPSSDEVDAALQTDEERQQPAVLEEEEEENNNLTYSKVAPYAQIRDLEHPYAQLESKHEYATLGEKETPSAGTYMTLSEANEETTYAAIEGAYALIGEGGGGGVKRPAVDESGYTLVNKAKKKQRPENSNNNNNNNTSSSIDGARPIEELYAKVVKRTEEHKGEEEMDEEAEQDDFSAPPPRPPRSGEGHHHHHNSELTTDGYEVLCDKKGLSRKDSENYEVLPEYPSRQSMNNNKCAASVSLRRQDSSVGYECLRDPYELKDPPYAELLKEEEEEEEEEEGYETIPRSEALKKDSDYDPAYEVVASKAHSEPAYETIEAQRGPSFACEEEEEEAAYEPSSLIYMSVQEPKVEDPSSSSNSNSNDPRASVVLIERLNVSEQQANENNNNNNNNLKEINTHIFV